MRTQATLTAAALSAALTLAPASFAQDSLGSGLVVREQGAVTYVSGGIGSAQQSALERASDRFNLKLTMATKDGKYIGRAAVRIADQQGRTLVDTTSDGPVFLAKVPPGTYHVEATASGKALGQDVSISGQGQKQLVLTWPQTADDEGV